MLVLKFKIKFLIYNQRQNRKKNDAHENFQLYIVIRLLLHV